MTRRQTDRHRQTETDRDRDRDREDYRKILMAVLKELTEEECRTETWSESIPDSWSLVRECALIIIIIILAMY